MAALSALAGALLATAAFSAPDGSGVRELEAELQALDSQAASAAQAREAAAARADDTREAIAENNRDMRRVRAARTRARDGLARRLVGIYTSEPASVASIVLTSRSVSEAVDLYRFQQELARNDAAILSGLRTTTTDLAELRAGLARERVARARALADSAEQLDQVQALVSQRRGVLERARASLAQAESQARARRLAADQNRRERDAEQGRVVAPSPAPRPEPAPSDPAEPASPADAGMLAHLERIAQCESGGNPRALSSSGLYRGKYQFDLSTWASVGGAGDPIDASEAEQDKRAQILYQRRGPAPWPVCGA